MAGIDDTAEGGRPTHRPFNLHFGGGVFFGLGNDLEEGDRDSSYGNVGGQALVGLDIVVKEPLAISVLGGFNATAGNDGKEGLRSMFIGLGLLVRLISDSNGALFDDGTAAGNLWLDAHLDYISHNFEDYGGYNVGLGYEFALWKDVNLGPYARFHHAAWGGDVKFLAMSFGIQISIGGRTGPDDSDEDGIDDNIDGCPDSPEDVDEFEDLDGCPDEDNDQDGVLDAEDECPKKSGKAQNKGCPVEDMDQDGLKNEDDACPQEAEDRDQFEDEDGCPDNDNDLDKVFDASDKCPMEAEDPDQFEDEDGCPDPDNDNDGLLDVDDQCPSEAETVNEKDDEDGCPDFIRVEEGRVTFIEKIEFAKNKDTIKEKSLPILDELAAVIIAKKDASVVIEAYTGEKGADKKNKELSEKRADKIKAYLVEKGAIESQLSAQGKGEAKSERIDIIFAGAKAEEVEKPKEEPKAEEKKAEEKSDK